MMSRASSKKQLKGCGGKVKHKKTGGTVKMKKGGMVCRGMGAASRGGKFCKNG